MDGRPIVLIVFAIFANGCSTATKHGQYHEGIDTLPAKSKKYSKIRIRVYGEELIKKHQNYALVKKYFEKKLIEYIKLKTNFKDAALVSSSDQGVGSLIISVKILDFRYRDAAQKVGVMFAGGILGNAILGKSEMRIYVLYLDGDSKKQISKLVISQRKGTTNSAIRKLSTNIAIRLNATGKSTQKFTDNSAQFE